MLPKQNRLTKTNEINKVFQHGKARYDKVLGVKALKNNLENIRFVILVSNKVSQKAVARNKIKRRIREIIRSQLPNLKSGYDCVLIALKPIVKLNYNQIKELIIEHFKQFGLYKDEKK